MKQRTIIFFIIFISLSSTICAQERIVFSSPHLKTNDTVLVFTPQQYEQGKTFPTLYLLHGWSGNYSNWSKRVLLQEVSDKYGFIIICPDGFYNSWYLDSSRPDGMKWKQFFDKELYPSIQERYHTVPDSCFITGLSMGGHGALTIFIDDPTRFRSVGSMSGVMDLRQSSFIVSEVTKVIGPFSAEKKRFFTESIINRVEMVGPGSAQDLQASKKMLIISCGYDDVYSEHSEKLAQKCRKLKIPHLLLLSPGNHSWIYWEYALDMHLTLFRKMLNKENLGY